MVFSLPGLRSTFVHALVHNGSNSGAMRAGDRWPAVIHSTTAPATALSGQTSRSRQTSKSPALPCRVHPSQRGSNGKEQLTHLIGVHGSIGLEESVLQVRDLRQFHLTPRFERARISEGEAEWPTYSTTTVVCIVPAADNLLLVAQPPRVRSGLQRMDRD